jgi:hypothetical protein
MVWALGGSTGPEPTCGESVMDVGGAAAAVGMNAPLDEGDTDDMDHDIRLIRMVCSVERQLGKGVGFTRIGGIRRPRTCFLRLRMPDILSGSKVWGFWLKKATG